MAPLLQRFSNYCYGKRAHIRFSDGKTFTINDGESQVINEYITNGTYTKIYRDFADEDQGYLLNYSDYNIDFNDNRGKNKGLQDYPVHTWRMYDNINIDIL